MFRVNSIDELTPQVIRKIIYQFKGQPYARLIQLKNYYLNNTKVLQRQVDDPKTQPNNKVVHPYAQYVSDTMVGYFMGEPVSYNSEQDLSQLLDILDYNDEQDENISLARDCSIYGVAYEYLYVDEDGQVRMKSMDPKEIIPIYGPTLEDTPIAVIRYYAENNIANETQNHIAEVYTDTEIRRYRAGSTAEVMELLDARPHGFQDVPFVVYKNNDDLYGDFEGVITLIDAYDSLVSDNLNDQEYFENAYLALKGYNASSEEIAQMKRDRIILLDDDGGAEWVLKNQDESGIETIKLRVERDIHKFTKTPDSSDTNFSSNVSGVAMKYKLLGTENVASIKERKFKKGLQRRFELIDNILRFLSRGSVDWRAIEIVFTRNLPINEEDLSTMVKNLNGIVSKETLVAQLPFVEDAEEEVKKLTSEQKTSLFYLRGAPYDSQNTQSIKA